MAEMTLSGEEDGGTGTQLLPPVSVLKSPNFKNKTNVRVL